MPALATRVKKAPTVTPTPSLGITYVPVRLDTWELPVTRISTSAHWVKVSPANLQTVFLFCALKCDWLETLSQESFITIIASHRITSILRSLWFLKYHFIVLVIAVKKALKGVVSHHWFGFLKQHRNCLNYLLVIFWRSKCCSSEIR